MDCCGISILREVEESRFERRHFDILTFKNVLSQSSTHTKCVRTPRMKPRGRTHQVCIGLFGTIFYCERRK